MNPTPELTTWLATATPEQVVERITRSEHEAFCWHVAMTCCTPQVAEPLRRTVERMAKDLIEGGYRRPEGT